VENLMLLQQIADALDLSLMTPSISLDRPVVSGYAADLLSCAMAAAKAGTLWITLQAHPNVVAVASLLNLAGVIITEGAAISAETLARATQENIPLFSTTSGTYTMAGKLAALGIVGAEVIAE
jgi:hypothetical protein